MYKPKKEYSFQEAQKFIGTGQSTLYDWIKHFKVDSDLIPGIFREGRRGWHFNYSGLETLARIKTWIRNDNWTYEQVKEELSKRYTVPTNTTETGNSDLQPYSGELPEYYRQSMQQVNKIFQKMLEENQQLRHEVNMMENKFIELKNQFQNGTHEMAVGRVELSQQLKEFQNAFIELNKPWYSKIWSWLNHPITWKGKEISIEIETDDKKSRKVESGMRRITEARAA